MISFSFWPTLIIGVALGMTISLLLILNIPSFEQLITLTIYLVIWLIIAGIVSRALPKFFVAVLLLTVTTVGWAACPEGYKNNYKGECVPVAGSQAKQIKKNSEPTKKDNKPRFNPYQNDLFFFESTKQDFTNPTIKIKIAERAHVPNLLIRSSGEIIAYFQWFPHGRKECNSKVHWYDSTGFVKSKNGQTWTAPRFISISEVPSNLTDKMGVPMDPSAIELKDGKIRLYFTIEDSIDPAKALAKIYSAISDDGQNFYFEPGTRFEVEGHDVRDPTIAYVANAYHLYIPQFRGNGMGYHALSDDGISFQRQDDVRLSSGKGDWLGGASSDGKSLYFFGSPNWVARTENGTNWKQAREHQLGPDPGIGFRGGRWVGLGWRPNPNHIEKPCPRRKQ